MNICTPISLGQMFKFGDASCFIIRVLLCIHYAVYANHMTSVRDSVVVYCHNLVHGKRHANDQLIPMNIVRLCQSSGAAV